MVNAPERESRVERVGGKQRDRLKHWYPGYSPAHTEPPAGAVAICGYVRRPEDADGGRTHFGRVDACIVCDDLRNGR